MVLFSPWEKTFPEGPDEGPSATMVSNPEVRGRAPLSRRNPHPPLRGYFSRREKGVLT
jgi:hypothetical protein